MPPELENLLKQVQIEGTLNAKDFVSSIFFTEDSDYIKEFRNDFKNKFIQPLSRQLKNFKPEDIKKIVDPLGVGDIADDLSEDFQKYRKKLKEFLNMDFPENNEESTKEKLKDTTVGEAIPEKVKDIETADIEEQKTFGQKVVTINFDESTKDFYRYLFKEISSYDYAQGERWRRKQSEYYEESLKNQEDLIALSEGSGILGTLAKVLAIGGIGALLLSTFWESHIKPWLEDTFDINLDFFDKFEGLVEGIGKFFTLGATGAGGLILKIQGKIFTSLADVLDNSIGAVLKGILGESAEGGVGKIISGGAKLFSGSWFARIAGNLFKGLSIVALKSIPIIGGLISLGFAIDRFGKGDYVGGVIDLVGGLADLLYFTPLAPLGLALSLGAAGLNAFLDIKYGGTGDRAAESKAKGAFLGDIASNIFNFFKKIPVIGGMIDGVVGLWNLLYSLAGGDQAGAKSALEQMTNFPILGALPAIMLAFLDITDSPEGTSKLSLPNFLQAFKKRVGQTVLKWFSWLPTSWQKSIAEFMGVPFDGSTDDDSLSSSVSQQKRMNQIKDTDVNEENIEIVQKNRDAAYKEYQEALRKQQEQDSFWGKTVTGKYETYEKMANNLADEVQMLNEKIKEYQEKNSSFSDADFAQGVADSFNHVAEEMRKDREDRNKESEEIPVVKVEDFYKSASGKSTLIFDNNSNTAFQTAPNDEVFAMKPDGVFDKALQEIKSVAFDINKNIRRLGESMVASQNEKVAPNMFNINNSDGGGYTGKEYLMEGERDAIFNDRIRWLGYSQNLRATI